MSITINRDYDSWDEIEGLSMGTTVVRVTDSAEQEKVSELMSKKFPQIAQYFALLDEELGTLVLFRVEPIVISLLDYHKRFGHTELVTLAAA